MGKKIVILGAGFAGQTAALYLGDALGKDHEITVINRNEYFGFVPAWVWTGIGHMKDEKTIFPLKPVYDKFNIKLFHGHATEINVDKQEVLAIHEISGEQQLFPYDYLVNATGPKLDFESTPGLGPKNETTVSICSLPHAAHAREKYFEAVARMEKGEKQTIIVGTGSGTATCQGAGFEYITNIHRDLQKRKLREKATLKWLSNEPVLGDFGVGGLVVATGKKVSSSEQFISTIFDEYDIESQVRSAVTRVEPGKIFGEDYDGNAFEQAYDFAMLIPGFKGIPLKYTDKDGNDITAKMTNPGGFMLVDGVYGKPYKELLENPQYWPATYKSPLYPNISAAGIAFAPPGPISKPHINPNGVSISPAPPRTGMVSGIIGRLVALNIIEELKGSSTIHTERMSEMYAACIASMGDSLMDGSAAVILIYPVVPNYLKYPVGGRDLFVSGMEMGLAGAWMKKMIQMTFMHKLRGRLFWSFIPE
jgi:sulfide:quinone oxidoreductase